MPAAKVDWVALENEYVQGQETYTQLARKYNVHLSTVANHAIKGQWKEKRAQYREYVAKKAKEKATENQISKLASLQSSADKLAERLALMLKDESAFNRYLVEVGSGRGQYETVERIYEKTDTKALRDAVASLRELSVAMRNLYGLPTEQEKATISIARERLELERIKAAAGQSASQDGTGVIFLPDAGDDGDGN